jgi:hypothetical protein
VTLSSLIVTCVTNPDALQETLSTLDASIGKGRILVDFTTGSPSQIRRVAQTAAQLGFSAYVHGSVMAFPAQVGRREAFMFYSGDHDAYASVETILSALGTGVYLDNDPVSAGMQEVIMVSSMYSWWAGFLQSMALLKTTPRYRSGELTTLCFYDETLAPVYQQSTEVFRQMCLQIDSGEYQTKGDGARLALHLASLKNFARTMREQGLSDTLIQPIMGLIEGRIAQGAQDDELSSLVAGF